MSDLLICIAGKNNIAVAVLEYLYNNCADRYNLCIVCNKTETGENGWQRSLRLRAAQLGIKEYTLPELYEIEDLIFLSLEFDQIVITERFKTKRLYNIHFSLLPAYKGMYTSAEPILNCEKYVGVTLHKIDNGIDTGDIIAQKKFELLDAYNCRDLYLAYIRNGIELVLDNIEILISNRERAVPQDSRYASYYSKKAIDYANINIDLRQTAWSIRQQIKAFSFREYQLPMVVGHNIIDAVITETRSIMKPGTVVEEMPQGIRVATIDYDIFLYYDRFDELLEACRKGDVKLVADICEVNRHVNEVSVEGWTPLIVAVYYGRTDCVKVLLERGADPFVNGRNGTNLLMYAKDAYWNTEDITLIDMFLELGIKPEKKDYDDHDLFYYIRENNVDETKKEKLLKYLACVG